MPTVFVNKRFEMKSATFLAILEILFASNLAWTVVATEPSSKFSVRSLLQQNVDLDVDNMSERRRQAFELKITFSEEGEPVEIPVFQLQLFPTPTALDASSEMILETSLEDYLRTYFEDKYSSPAGEDEDDTTETTSPAFRSVSVDILEMRPVISTDTRMRGRRQLQRQGTELDVQTTLRFDDGIFPENSELEQDMSQSLRQDFDVFVRDYLSLYATDNPELDAIDSGAYLSSFTSSPTTSPTVSPPRTIGALNTDVQNNANGKGSGVGYALYPAIGAGVAVFVITALILSARRRRNQARSKKGWYGDASSRGESVAHVSVDFDGREEAMEVERRRRQQEEEEEAYARQEISRRLKEERLASLTSSPLDCCPQDPPAASVAPDLPGMRSESFESREGEYANNEEQAWRDELDLIRATSPSLMDESSRDGGDGRAEV